MGIIVLEIFFALIGCGGIAWLILAKDYRWIGALVTAVMILVGAWALLATMYTPVGTSDVGVLTAFGKTRGDLTPGIHWVAPWDNVTVWDGSVQTISYPRSNCLQVKIGAGQAACITLTFTYRIRSSAVDDLFVQYRTQANAQSTLVAKELDSAINTQLQDYSPITEVQKGSADPTSMVPFIAPIVSQMQSDIGDDIEMSSTSLVMPYVTFDAQTTSRLNAYQTQKVDTLIAQEAILTAQAQATALKDLQQSTASSPNAIAEQCFVNVMEPIVKAGGNPAGIECWQGGSSPSVVITPRS